MHHKALHLFCFFIVILLTALPASANNHKKGDTWTDPTTGMEFVWVPGGCFEMGYSGLEKTKPVHEVCVDGFWMGKYEVTQAEWEHVMANNPSSFKGDRNPVEKVSWNNTQLFINKLNAKGKGTFRLPTEAEWEYAARSGGKKERFAGSDKPEQVAWFYSYTKEGKTHPVGQKASNGLGLYDMSGNVLEWCQDTYNSSAYSSHSRNNPIYSGSGDLCVIRGGSWFDNKWDCRTYIRKRCDLDATLRSIGFRLVRTEASFR